ncbi:umecyanin-like [Durio zibethinus]|uniref:Umecyanin-like n=1 Tax=Durio zibethinus TaxID=66656 RepID=A0A6P5XR42_DURZI|nr:umecyanin-like [Durio zibethinus]
MARKNSMAAVFVVLAATLLQSSYATNYTVGDSTGWRVPTGNINLYDDWADNKNFMVGDVLVFNFATGSHDVAEVTETVYDPCNTTNTIYNVTTGPASIPLNTTGDHYFICTFGSHCSEGQKLKVEVHNGTGTSSPPSSASSLVATLPLVFMSIALALLC